MIIYKIKYGHHKKVPLYTHPSFPTPDDINFTGSNGFPVVTQNLQI
jgi:hypothetical protein